MRASPVDSGAESARPYLRRIERLFRRFVRRGGPDGPEELWQFQLDLMAVQRDIQKAIAEAKRSGPAGYEALQSLRSARWHARRLGDAFAWIVLGMDRQHIFPLAQNAPVAVGPEGHGSRGMTAIAEALSGEGWGFPLLHDATDILRIGDITFVKPGRLPLTVEVKTRVEAQEPVAGEERTETRYAITVMSAHELPAGRSGPPTAAPAPPPEKVPVPARRRREQPRVERQIRRLQKARLRQAAEPDTVFEDEDGPVLNRRVRTSHRGHQDALRRVVRKARAYGYGSEAVEDTFLYVGVYEPAGISSQRLPTALVDRLPQDLIASGILDQQDKDRNALVVNQVPQQEGRGPGLFLPYYLLDLPRVSVCDLLHGRMLLFNFVNSGRVAQALERAGFSVEFRSGRNDLQNESLRVHAQGADPDGVPYRAELGNLGAHVTEMIQEFRSVSHLTDIAQSMLAAVVEDRAQAAAES